MGGNRLKELNPTRLMSPSARRAKLVNLSQLARLAKLANLSQSS